jgi:hypothetical protein
VASLVQVTLVNQVESCIDHLMRLDCKVAVRLSQKVHVWALSESHKKLCLEDAPDFSETSEEWAFLQRFDHGVHSHRVVILVSHNSSSTQRTPTRDSTGFDVEFPRNLSEFNQLSLVRVC